MATDSELSYCYDGSFEGLLCCVFESYAQKEIPAAIYPPNENQTILFGVKNIRTDPDRAQRVFTSIPQKIGQPALEFIERAFLTCLPQKELYILLFLRLGYHYGPRVLELLTNDAVNTLQKAVKHLNKEAELLLGFLRFSVYDQVLIAEIEPKNYVLPLLTRHFCARYREERFLIYDKTHGMGLIYQPYQAEVVPLDALELPEIDEREEKFRQLWKQFYQTIEVPGRHNPTCRMSHMPKRYWKYMTEFQ